MPSDIEREAIEELFLSYIDGDLDEAARAAFEERTRTDGQFRQEFERYRRTVDLLRSVGPAPAPESLLRSVQRRLARRALRDTPLQVRFPYELLAFVFILAGILYVFFTMVPEPPSNVGPREHPVLLTVELAAPVPDSIVARFGLEAPPEAPAAQRQLYGRLSREQALALLRELTPIVRGTPPKLPAGDLFGILLDFGPLGPLVP